MKKILILVFVLTLSLRTTEAYGMRIANEPGLDGWTISHFCGGIGGVKFLNLFGVKPVPAFIVTTTLGICWEVICDGYQNKLLPVHGPDPNGADFFGDALWVGLGAYLEYWRLSNKLSCVSLAVGPRFVGVKIRL